MSMKSSKFILVAIAIFLMATYITSAQSNAPKYDYVEASDLTLIGKIFPGTPNPYHRVDTTKYKGWTPGENFQVRMSSGIAVVFVTNSKNIVVKTNYGQTSLSANAAPYAYKGYDLYIRKDGKWLWAGANGPGMTGEDRQYAIVSHMDGTTHECLMYLPLYSEEKGILIGVDHGAMIEPMETPFRHRVAIWGSSFTHGASCGRAGMTYPAIFTRRTGIQLLSMAMSGNCKMQSYAAEALKDADVEAYIFDTFSNPSLKEVSDRLFPFIETIQSTHPDVPLIFQRTIRREGRNFDTSREKFESDRIHLTDSLMKIACKKYKNVYYIHPDATEKTHEATIDGTHPSNYGYELWEASIEKKVLKILRKYGIK